MQASSCLAVDESGYVLTFDGSQWSAPTRLSPVGFAALSCSGPTFCVAIDANGIARIFNGSTWSSGTAVSAPSLGELSCTSATFCMYVSDSGWSYTFDGTSWSAPIDAFAADGAEYGLGLSCVSAAFCLELNTDGYTRVWNGTHWQRVIPGPNALALSCMTINSCAAIDKNDDVWIYDGTSWVAGPTIANTFGTTAELWCAPAGCVTVDSDLGDIYYFNATSTTATPVAPSGPPLDAADPQGLACAPGYCLVLRYGGGADAVWTQAGVTGVGTYPPRSTFYSLSCPGSGPCQSFDDSGHGFTAQNGAWSETPFPLTAIPFGYSGGIGEISRRQGVLSCTSATFCIAVGAQPTQGVSNPNYQPGSSTFNGTSWTSPAATPTSGSDWFEFADCASATLCWAGDSQSNLYKWNGSIWDGSAPQIPPTNQNRPLPRAASCPSTDFCAVAANVQDGSSPEGEVAFWTSTSGWSTPTVIGDPVTGLADISCASSTFCVALDNLGSVMVYNGSTWSQPTSLNPYLRYPDNDPTGFAISCGSPSLCTALVAGGVYTWDGSAWSGNQIVDTDNPLVDASCGTPTTCVILDIWGYTYTYTKP